MSAAPLKIFLVEDSPILRERLIGMLQSWGSVEIVAQADTEQAAEVSLRQKDWDVLILDLQLLNGTGLGVLRNLAPHRKPGTVVIVLTNYAIPLYRTRSMELGADHFFDKAHEFGRIKDVLNDLRAKTPTDSTNS